MAWIFAIGQIEYILRSTGTYQPTGIFAFCLMGWVAKNYVFGSIFAKWHPLILQHDQKLEIQVLFRRGTLLCNDICNI